MKGLNLYSLIFAGLIIASSFSNNFSQAPFAPPEGENPRRPNLLEELNLSDVQIRQIRQLNQERKPMMMAAQHRFREANRLLDETIYGDVENETEIQTRMQEVQAAQAELIKLRTMNERAIRKILTPEQLVKFRELRNQFNPENRLRNNPGNRRQKLRNLPRNNPGQPGGGGGEGGRAPRPPI